MKTNAYDDFLKNELLKSSFATSDELSQKLMKEFHVTKAHCRQLISRAVNKKVIKSSEPLHFSKNQFVYLNNDYELEITSLTKISKQLQPPLYRLLELLTMNNGIISYYEGLKITASPSEFTSSKILTLREIISSILPLDILYMKDDSNGITYILLKKGKRELPQANEASLIAQHFTKMKIDTVIMYDIIDWLSKSNVISERTSIYRNKKKPDVGATHNKLYWDAFSYTKSTGYHSIVGDKSDSPEKKTLVVLDVVLASEYSKIHLDAFYARIQINRNSVYSKERKILPIIFYQQCGDETLNRIKKLGIVAYDIGSIFGTKIFEVLNTTQDLFSNSLDSDEFTGKVEGILSVIENAGLKETLKDFRGTLFEFLLYPLLSILFPNCTIDRGKILKMKVENSKTESYEFDYIIVSNHPKERVLIELKGYHDKASISLGDEKTKASIKWFFEKKYQFAKRYFSQDGQNELPLKLSFITSANFTKTGDEYLETLQKSKLKSDRLSVGYNRNSLIKLLEKYDFNNEVKIIKKFYIQKNDDLDKLPQKKLGPGLETL